MNAKYIFFGIVAFVFYTKTAAQLSTPFNLYFVNPAIYNPASAVDDNGITAYSNYRHQWMGLKGSPEYLKFGAYGSITDNMGLSLNASSFKNGMLTNNELNVAYAYRVVINESNKLTLGASYGMYRLGIDKTDNIEEAAIDPTAYANNFNGTFVKTGFGVSYQFQKLKFDIAIPELYDQSKKAYFSSIYSFVSYDVELSEKMWIVKPIVGYRNYYNSASQLDFGAICTYQQRFWLHTGYRTSNGMLFSGGVYIDKITIAYSYEFASSVMSNVSSGSNEISLLYCFGSKSKKY